jgi:hypothetical protein
MISTLYYLFKIGALDNIVSILKKRLNDRREFKFYKENFMNKGYKKFEVGEDLNLPFNIYIYTKTRKIQNIHAKVDENVTYQF